MKLNKAQQKKLLGKVHPNWVDIHRQVWDGNDVQMAPLGFLKQVQVEVQMSVSRKAPGQPPIRKFHKSIHVTGMNFGFTVDEKQARLLAQLLNHAADELSKERQEQQCQNLPGSKQEN